MNLQSRRVQRTYLTLLLCNTLAASFIWGINTLFLLDAGLNNTEAFAANAFFTVGLMLSEIPTGIIADLQGRRLSYLLGTSTLAISTLLYLFLWETSAPFWTWAVASAVLGLGFAFFSGAVEAWLVDALTESGYEGDLESVFAKGQVVRGVAMLAGSVAGGVIAQYTNLGVPYMLRIGILLLTFILAVVTMKDLGFTPKARTGGLTTEAKAILRDSISFGVSVRPVRWIVFTAPFSMGVTIYVFYAMQPYLLDLSGDDTGYAIAGLAAAAIAGAQIVGGFIAPAIAHLFKRRTSLMLVGLFGTAFVIAIAGLLQNFWVVVSALIAWGIISAITAPVRQAYLNELIPSQQRATVLSFDSLAGSAGGVVSQPALGKVADVWSYPTSYVVAAVVQLAAVPFAVLARREHASSESGRSLAAQPAEPTTADESGDLTTTIDEANPPPR